MAAITVGQIKATASKIYNDMTEINQEALNQYNNSFLKASDIADFIEKDAVAKTVIQAYTFITSCDNERIQELKVAKGKVLNEPKYSWNTVSVNRETNLDDVLRELFEIRVKYKLPYKCIPVPEIVDKLNYNTITSGNLLEVEEIVKQELYTGPISTTIEIYE